jgi:hypothetical protein
LPFNSSLSKSIGIERKKRRKTKKKGGKPMTPEETVDQWLKAKSGNSSMRDDIVQMLKDERRQAFREVYDRLINNKHAGMALYALSQLPDFQQAIRTNN